jgi:metal-sulfur cluster biosynthetic enzyme
MAKVTVAEVVKALKGAVDPELGINVVDMGLVYGICVSGKGDVGVDVTMTSPLCPVAGIILADIQLRVERIPGAGKVSVELAWEPAWNPGMMSEESRESLGA